MDSEIRDGTSNAGAAEAEAAAMGAASNNKPIEDTEVQSSVEVSQGPSEGAAIESVQDAQVSVTAPGRGNPLLSPEDEADSSREEEQVALLKCTPNQAANYAMKSLQQEGRIEQEHQVERTEPEPPFSTAAGSNPVAAPQVVHE